LNSRERLTVSRTKHYSRPGTLRSAFNLLFRIIRGAFLTFSNAKGAEASSSLAYYTVFSIFPLLLVIVSVGSLLVDPAIIEQEMIKVLPNLIPVSQDYLLSNLEQLLKVRGTVSIISLAGLIWSSSAVFATLIRNVNSAWPSAAPHSFISMRLVSLGIVGILAILMILSSFSITLKNVIINLGIPVDFNLIGTFFSSTFFTQVVPFVIRIILFYGLFYLVPQIYVKKSSALAGSFLTAVIWQAVSVGLNAYLSMRLPQYEIVYGSVAKVIVLLAWIYFSGWIVLFGAHLTSSIDRHTQ
jgi:YihY family inner membrane protein